MSKSFQILPNDYISFLELSTHEANEFENERRDAVQKPCLITGVGQEGGL